jgi:predicted metalloendopeptidase
MRSRSYMCAIYVQVNTQCCMQPWRGCVQLLTLVDMFFFAEYTCGKWVEEAVIPPHKTSIGKSWDGAREQVQKELLSLMTKEWPADSPYIKLRHWYDSCMDLETVNALGAAPLQPMLEIIDTIQTLEDFQNWLVQALPLGLPTFLHIEAKEVPYLLQLLVHRTCLLVQKYKY